MTIHHGRKKNRASFAHSFFPLELLHLVGTTVITVFLSLVTNGIPISLFFFSSAIHAEWSALDSGMDGTVYALVADNSGNLYAGGDFTTAGGITVNRIAKWNGSSWSALDDGMNGVVNALAIDNSDNLYAGGNFTTAGGITVNRIAKWNGSSWSALGSGMNEIVNALAIDNSGNLYAGGNFIVDGAVSANRIAKWNGSSWSALGTGMNTYVYVIAIDNNDNLYAGGSFITAGGVITNRIAKWDGNSWSALGDGTNNNVYTLVIDKSNNLYAGGDFTTAGGITVDRVAKWDGSSWSVLGSGMDDTVNALAIDNSSNLYAGGNFTTVDGRIAKWNGNNWGTVGTGMNDIIYALTIDNSGNLYAGGNFTTAAGVTVNRIAKWVPPVPEITVLGNNTEITNGDTTPTTSDDTDFGNVNLGSSIDKTFTIQNTGNKELTLTSPLNVTGTSFSVRTSPPSSVIAVNASTSFVLRFAPSSGNLFTGIVEIDNDDSDENPYTFHIQGQGISSTSSTTPPPSPSLPPPSLQIPTIPPAQPLPTTMKLTIGFGGNGHGRVTTAPSGINCNSSQVKCSHTFNTATWIKLKVAAAADSQFIRWSGNRSDCEDGEVFITNSTGCIAYFDLLRFLLTITTTGQGKVSSKPVGINCGDKCRYLFDINTKVTLTAIPNKGWQFKEWNNTCIGTSPQTIVTMDQAKICTATFIKAKLPPTDFFYTDNQKIPLAVKSSQLGVLFKEDVDLNSIENLAKDSNMTFIKKIRENMVIFGVLGIEDRLSLAQLARELKQQHSEIAQAGLVVEVISPRNVPPLQKSLPVESTPMIVSDEFIVRFKSNVRRNQIEKLNQELAQQFVVEIVEESTFLKNLFLLKTTENTPATSLELSNRYKESELTEYAHPNCVQTLEFRSNDTLFGKQWYHENTGQQSGTANADIDTPAAWNLTEGSSDVVIAVIDDGFDMEHEDLKDNYWSNPSETVNGVDDDSNNYVDDIHGWNFAANNNQLNPEHQEPNDNHGTAIAGAIAAIGNNNKGIIGSCPNCKIMPLRIGSGIDTYSIAEAFGYAQDNGTEIIVNAWGYPPNTPRPEVVRDAIDTVTDADIIVFFAMSNGYFDDCTGTTSLQNVIAVSSSTNKDLFDQAGYGDCMDLLAPSAGLTTVSSGRGTLAITTTDRQGSEGYNSEECTLNSGECYPSGLGETPLTNYTNHFGGTSFATALTAGVAGLILSADPTLTREQVQNLLQDTADKIDTGTANYDPNTGYSRANTHGYGRVNAFEAVRVVAPTSINENENGKGGVDIFLRDNYFDWGNTAQSRFPESVQSVDIKVDASPFSPPIADDFDAFLNEIPELDEINKVYLRVRNRGPNTANNVIVKIYWAQAKSDGTFPNLPEDFWEGNTGDWHSLNCGTTNCSVNVEYSGSSVAGQIVTFNFEPIFNSDNLGKFRLLAIVDSTQDPPVKDQFNVNELARGDNNVTYHDLDILTLLDPCKLEPWRCPDLCKLEPWRCLDLCKLEPWRCLEPCWLKPWRCLEPDPCKLNPRQCDYYPPICIVDCFDKKLGQIFDDDDYDDCLSCPPDDYYTNRLSSILISTQPLVEIVLPLQTSNRSQNRPFSIPLVPSRKKGERDDISPLFYEQNYAFITTLQKSLAKLNLPLLVLESNGKRSRLEVPLFNSEAAEIPQAWYSVWVGKTIEWTHKNVPVTGIFTNQLDDVIYLVFQGKEGKYYQSSLYPALHPEIIMGLIKVFPKATLTLSEQGLITFTQDNETSQFRISYLVTPSGFTQDPLKIKPLQGDILELSAHGKSQQVHIVNQ